MPILRTINAETNLIIARREFRRQIKRHLCELQVVRNVSSGGEIDLRMQCPLFIQQVNEVAVRRIKYNLDPQKSQFLCVVWQSVCSGGQGSGARQGVMTRVTRALSSPFGRVNR